MANLAELFNKMELTPEPQGMEYNDRVLLVDGTNLFIRSYCAVPSMDEDGTPIGGTVGFIKSLALVTRSFKPTRVIVVFDGKGGSQRRRKLFPEYKQNRKPPLRLNRAHDFTTEAQESNIMAYQLTLLVDLLGCLPVTTFTFDNVEADDVIAHLTQLVTAEGGKSIILSSDKDFFQLASESVTVYNPVKKKTFSEQVILEDYGIHPKHFYFFRALNGDASDNINGVKGVGEITLRKHIPEISDPSVTIDFAYIKKKYGNMKKVPKMITNILDNEDIVERNIKLMNLHDSIMSSDSKMKVTDRFHSILPTVNKHELTTKLVKSKLIHSFPNYDGWFAQSFMPLARFSGT